MNSHMNFIKEQLYTLTSIPSPSSFTAKVTDYLLSELSSLGYSPERSNKGNVFVTLGGSGSPLVLAQRTARTAPFTLVMAEFTPV